MAATGTGSLIFTDDITADDSSKMKSKVYRNILCAQFKQMPPNSLASDSSYSKTMIPNIMLKQQRSFSKLKNGQFLTDQVT
ncbi:hypothetical protein LDENG_00105320 [Lucifuga dentata]|nr:hypothetical protein LDENG_00105320 [Lucifuga dentata]